MDLLTAANRHKHQTIIIMQLYTHTIHIYYAHVKGNMHVRCNPQCYAVVVTRRCLQLSITYLASPGADGLRYIPGQVALCTCREPKPLDLTYHKKCIVVCHMLSLIAHHIITIRCDSVALCVQTI